MPTVKGLTETMTHVIRRAQEAGVLREDMIVDDVPMVMCGIGSATKKQHRARARGDATWRSCSTACAPAAPRGRCPAELAAYPGA